jgi:hypothetical protein
MYGPGFSDVEINFRVFFIAAQVVPASARASVNSGSRPLGNAPACLEITNVSGPAETGPADVVAQLARIADSAARMTVRMLAPKVPYVFRRR